MFEAKHGTGFQGDIAIDDIVAQPGRCGDPGIKEYLFANPGIRI